MRAALASTDRSAMKFADILAAVLTLAGGLNWGLIAFCGCDVIELSFGFQSEATRIAYGVVGVAALYLMCSSPWIIRRWKISGEGLRGSFMVD